MKEVKKKHLEKFRDIAKKINKNKNYLYIEDFDAVDPFDIMVKSEAENNSFIFKNTKTCLYKYLHCDSTGLIIMYVIPKNDIKKNKNPRDINDKLISLLKFTEDSLIYLDYTVVIEKLEDKFLYFFMIKNLY